MKASAKFFSTGEAANILRAQAWQVARLFELGLLDEPARVAGRRVIPAAMVPVIATLLKQRGWMDDPQEDVDEV